MPDKEWIRNTVGERLNAIYGLKNPSVDQVDEMVDKAFSKCPAFQFPGYKPIHPLFGCWQGKIRLKSHYRLFYDSIEVLELNKQFIIVDSFSASAHYQAKFKIKESGSVYDFEIIALVDLDPEGRVRDLKLHFDNSTFLKAVNNKNKSFKDVRAVMPHPKFNPNSKIGAGELMSGLYTFFEDLRAMKAGKLEDMRRELEEMYTLFADDAEISFKSNTDVIPYAGQFSGRKGVQQWFEGLLSNWNLATFNFTKVYAEGNVADFAMDEQHYFINPDGSNRYLSCYIVQSWTFDEDKKVCYFQSNHDSSWMENVMLVTQAYKDYYGYPKDYPPTKKT